MRFIPLHGVPAILSPVLPILNDYIHRKLSRPELAGVLKNVVARGVPFAALDEAVRPEGEERNVPGDRTVAGYNLVACGACENDVVEAIGNRGPQNRLVPGRPP